MRENVKLSDRIIAASSYITMGLIGFIYYIVASLLKMRKSNFLSFNVLQSIFFSFTFSVIGMTFDFLYRLFSYTPVTAFLNKFILGKIEFIFNRPFLLDCSLIQIIIFPIVIYMTVFALIGKKPRLYFFSKVVDSMVN